MASSHLLQFISLLEVIGDLSRQLWAQYWFRSARLLPFVAAGAEPTRLPFAAWKTIDLTDFSKDIIRDKAGNRIAVDATGGGLPRPEVKSSAETAALIMRRWKEHGVA